MDVAAHATALRREGQRLAAVAARAGLQRPVPTCPGWRVRDLVRHLGYVHRWATGYVAEGRTEKMGDAEAAAVVGPFPDDGGLLGWFRAGHEALADAIEAADPDLACWTFLPAASPLAFWARRQAHETAVHRADAESACGPVTPFPADFAADGIDELLFAFAARRARPVPVTSPRRMHLHATDVDVDRLVTLHPDRVESSLERGDADVAVLAPASDLYLLLWNRCSSDGLDVRGDRSVLATWRDAIRVRWV